jgi:hypothetical protein
VTRLRRREVQEVAIVTLSPADQRQVETLGEVMAAAGRGAVLLTPGQRGGGGLVSVIARAPGDR